ncbi:MAG TPA: c-type cytochrome [Steroidobacteraceae bacterium]|nr:c-type cytochrome [Steroidobacteraceae bacterium]
MSVRMFTAPLILFAIAAAAYAADPGDAAAGKAYFTQTCRQCHSAEPGDGGGEIGPSLIGLFGRTAGVGDTRFAYSKALTDSKLVWNAETLGRFLTDPAATVPGTTMALPIPVKQDRDNVIAYFQSLAGGAK